MTSSPQTRSAFPPPYRLIAPLLFLAILLLAAPATACPMCSESQPNITDTQTPGAAQILPPKPDAAAPMTAAPAKPALAEGVYYSIVFMLIMIYGVPLTLGTMLYLAYKKHAPRNPTPSQTAHPLQPSSPTPVF